VVALAHILTGWTVGAGTEEQDSAARAADRLRNAKGVFRFAAKRHDPSQETLLGKQFSGADVSEGEAALLMLARHPSTAHHISFKLAQYFLADDPDSGVVKQMVATFQGTDGDIRSVLRTLFESEAFLSPANFGSKFKTPYRFVVSAARVSGTAPNAVRPLPQALVDLGQKLYGCISPDGYACTQAAWLDPGSLLRRLSLATAMGGGEYGRAQFESDKSGGMRVDPDTLLAELDAGFSKHTLSIIAQTDRDKRAGVIIGSPDFMRC
jgi:uncharacterized protein (DUF1800 family)